MNFLDYLTNAMTGAAPSQQELMMRQMAAKGLLGDPNSVVRESEMNMYDPNSVVRESEMRTMRPAQMPEYVSPKGQIPSVQMPQVRRQSGTLPPVQMPSISSGYMQNLINPGMTMQQNYIDPRLIEMMYYRGLLNQ